MSTPLRASFLPLLALAVACGDKDTQKDSDEPGVDSCIFLFNRGDTIYNDGDRDGVGALLIASEDDCYESGTFVSEGGDCDDSDPATHPFAEEQCDGVDRDCNGVVDDVQPDNPAYETYFVDFDEDTYGDPSTAAQGWVPPTTRAILNPDGGPSDMGATGGPGADDIDPVLLGL